MNLQSEHFLYSARYAHWSAYHFVYWTVTITLYALTRHGERGEGVGVTVERGRG